MTRDELIELLSDVTSLLGAALAKEVELKESLAGAGVESQRLKIDATKAKLADEKLKLSKLKDAANRKRELEKRRQDNERQTARSAANESKNSGTVTLRDASGRAVGFMRVMGPNRTDFFDRTGKLVAREVGNVTCNGSGRAVFRGRLGLVALGASLGRWKPLCKLAEKLRKHGRGH